MSDFEGFNLKKIFITNPVSTMEGNGVNNVLPHRGGIYKLCVDFNGKYFND